MNDRQRKILVSCAVLIGAMLLYPPFQIMGRGMGYAWIFKPPHQAAIINAGQLLVQWVAVILLGGVAYVLAKNAARSSDEPNISIAPRLTSENRIVPAQLSACITCGNRETIERKRSFLGFQKCRCTICDTKFLDPLFPLSKGYRVTYWVIGVWFGVLLLGKVAALLTAATHDFGVFIDLLIEQWAFILFTSGAFWALRKDAEIRGNVSC